MAEVDLMKKQQTLVLVLVAIALIGAMVANLPRNRRADDEEVIETVLLHYLQDTDKEVALFGEGRDEVLLLSTSPEKTGMVQPEQVLYDAGKDGPPRSLVEALYARNKGKQGYEAVVTDFSKFRLDRRIRVGKYSPDELGMRWPTPKTVKRAKALFECYAPGYSADRKTALVRAWVGPTAHGAAATYLLERSAFGWKVTWRKISYFL